MKTREVYEQKNKATHGRAPTPPDAPSIQLATRRAPWGRPIGMNVVRRRSLKSW